MSLCTKAEEKWKCCPTLKTAFISQSTIVVVIANVYLSERKLSGCSIERYHFPVARLEGRGMLYYETSLNLTLVYLL